jgi:serine-type D-Ala-D-Ala carboxypeptidase/endopeptidase
LDLWLIDFITHTLIEDNIFLNEQNDKRIYMKKEMSGLFDLQKTIIRYIFVDLVLTLFFQNNFQLAYSLQLTSITNSSNSPKNEISNALLEQFKEIVFNQSSSKSSNNVAMTNSGIPIVVDIVTTNGTQVSGFRNISSSNNTQVDGDTVFDIASIAKTFVTIILADMVKQGLVSLDNPIEKYLPTGNVTVPSYDGHKIKLEDLATHTSGLPDFPGIII